MNEQQPSDPPVQAEEIVDARFVPTDVGATFSIAPTVPQVEGFTGKIKFGDVVRMRRTEATQRADFQIVGEEESTTSSDALGAIEAFKAFGAQKEAGASSVVAPPPPPLTETTTDAGEDAPNEEN